jgi:hypothetical protein
MPATAEWIGNWAQDQRLTAPTLAIGGGVIGTATARRLEPITGCLDQHLLEDCGHTSPRSTSRTPSPAFSSSTPGPSELTPSRPVRNRADRTLGIGAEAGFVVYRTAFERRVRDHLGDASAAETRVLIELLLGRHIPHERLVAELATALRAGPLTAAAVALEASKAAQAEDEPAAPARRAPDRNNHWGP